jgi:hypothetical protein
LFDRLGVIDQHLGERVISIIDHLHLRFEGAIDPEMRERDLSDKAVDDRIVRRVVLAPGGVSGLEFLDGFRHGQVFLGG